MISAVVAAAFVLSIAVIAKGARMGLASFEYLGRGIHEELLRWRARRARPGRTVLLGRVIAEPEGLVERRVVFERHGLRCRWTRYLYFRIGWWQRTSDTVSVAPFWLETIQGMRVRVIPDARTVFHLKCGESKYLDHRHILAARVGVSDSVLVQGELRRGPEPQRADPYRHHEEGSPSSASVSMGRGCDGGVTAPRPFSTYVAFSSTVSGPTSRLFLPSNRPCDWVLSPSPRTHDAKPVAMLAA